jgi:hypothetical protein
MEVKDLSGFVLLIVITGMLLGVGVLFFGNFGSAARVERSVGSEAITITNYNSSVALAHGNLTAFTALENYSGDAFPSENYTVDLTAGTITLDNVTNSPLNQSIGEGNESYATYDYYDYDTATADAMDAMNVAVSPIATTWIPLIVTVAVLSIVLLLVLRSFQKR